MHVKGWLFPAFVGFTQLRLVLTAQLLKTLTALNIRFGINKDS